MDGLVRRLIKAGIAVQVLPQLVTSYAQPTADDGFLAAKGLPRKPQSGRPQVQRGVGDYAPGRRRNVRDDVSIVAGPAVSFAGRLPIFPAKTPVHRNSLTQLPAIFAIKRQLDR